MSSKRWRHFCVIFEVMKTPGMLLTLQIFLLLGCCQLEEAALCQSTAIQEHKGNIKRLILKDGSFESINQYSIQADRVRYFSTERHSWEELPYSLIDWDATGKYAELAGQEVSKRVNEALERASDERREEENRAPLVSPGLRLPSPDGVFLLDTYLNRPELSQLTQNGAGLKKNTGSNIIRGIINPVARARQTVELDGLHARIQSHVLSPVIYFSIPPGDPQTGYDSATAKDHLRIVKCQEKGGNRVVIDIEIAVYGKVSQRARYMDAGIERVSDYWVKITPSAPLLTGEYALVEIDDKGAANEFVWDFGVNPSAAANPAMQRNVTEEKAPVLIQKPRGK
jgi:hypothetical protein